MVQKYLRHTSPLKFVKCASCKGFQWQMFFNEGKKCRPMCFCYHKPVRGKRKYVLCLKPMRILRSMSVVWFLDLCLCLFFNSTMSCVAFVLKVIVHLKIKLWQHALVCCFNTVSLFPSVEKQNKLVWRTAQHFFKVRKVNILQMLPKWHEVE